MPCASRGSSRTRRRELDDLLLALRVVVSLAAVLGALWLIQRRLSRGTAGQSKREPIRVVAKQGLGAKAQLVVVDVEGSRYVLGVTEGGVSVVDRLPLDAAEAATAAPAADTTTGVELAPAVPLPLPLPLRRTLNRTHSPSAAAGRPFGRSASPARGAAEVLRRALGA